ncbi:hypothetical protein MHBO_000534 [Bonamia ostreae]|uniref:Tricarboxylate transport protein n=1 Tax=Bonamia ostreae TaxID=126728 RepID=A0ABV2AGK3_9EUKA
MYRGLSCLLFFSVPKNASRFFAYENLRKLMEGPDGKISTGKTVLCGLGSGLFEALTVVTPMETLKVKLIHDQLQNAKGQRKYRNFFHGVYRIVSEQGIAATYRGLSATLLKQGSNQAIRWLVYSKLKAAFAKEGQAPNSIGPLKTALAGAIAGAASVYGNTPLDVIKTRLQGLQAHNYNGFVDCAQKIWREEGPLAFYKGVTPRMMRVCADVAIVMVVYEQVMRFLDIVWKTD